MMDKKSTIGLILIGGILAVWVFMSGPTAEQKAKLKHIADSTQAAILAAEKKAIETTKQLEAKKDSALKIAAVADTSKKLNADSLKTAAEMSRWKDFYPASKGTAETIVIENEKLKAFISTKSGRITSVTLKEFMRADKKTPVTLFDDSTSHQHVIINAYNDIIYLDSLYFTADKKGINVSGDKTESIKLKLATSKPGSYIEYVYSLKGNDFLVGHKINFVRMDSIINPGSNTIMEWKMKYPSQEKHIENEKKIATVFYRTKDGSSDNIGIGQSESEDNTVDEIKWAALKQQFFSAAVINDELFMPSTHMKIETLGSEENKTHQDSMYVKEAEVRLAMPDPTSKTSYSLKYYFGPNDYNTLASYEMGLEDMIPMGWSFFAYINKLLVVPVFSLFEGTNFGFGWVILILTLVIKGLLFPIAYMTYKSSAKMKVLKPETDALTEKYGKDGDPMKKQQETMALYRRAGVSPFSGCLPLVFQMFVLIALFNYFPAAFELRQQPFLWTDDLSTYDSVLDFGFNIPMYGNHVSMFALLMFISTLAFTWYQQKMFPNQQSNMPGMKFMMYAMPFIFLGFMNSYSAGLSWYYFVANVINIVQNLALRRFVSDEKLRAEVEANMRNPQKKKGGFAARLEEMAKQRQQLAKKK